MVNAVASYAHPPYGRETVNLPKGHVVIGWMLCLATEVGQRLPVGAPSDSAEGTSVRGEVLAGNGLF